MPYITPHRTTKVGILYSQTGPLAITELPLIDATMLAIDQINQKSGLLNTVIEPIIIDAHSDPAIFAQEAEKLINQYKVKAIFGCWTTSSLQAVKPIIEKHNNILFYPGQYEGFEKSLHIIYTGVTITQLFLPGVSWGFFNVGKKFYLIGSDNTYQKIAHVVLEKQIEELGGSIVGRSYIPIKENNIENFRHAVDEISSTKPELILNTIHGIDNMIFFKLLRDKGISSQKIPTMSFSISIPEIMLMDVNNFVGDYLCSSYFQSISSVENRYFIEIFKNKFGSQRLISDAMESAYCSVLLWQQAVKQANSTEPHTIIEAIKEQGLNAPGGIIFIDPVTLQSWKNIRIGRIKQNGQCDIVWDSKKPLRPSVYPPYESTEFWDAIVRKFSEQ